MLFCKTVSDALSVDETPKRHRLARDKKGANPLFHPSRVKVNFKLFKGTSMITLNRRTLTVLAAAILASAAAMPSWAQAVKPIIIGQTAALTGQLSLANIDVNRGIQAHFDEINAKGGIRGRPLRFVSLEDQADPEKAKANFKQLVSESGAVAMLATGGTVVTAALIPLANENKIPI